jgi:hypothetical protein
MEVHSQLKPALWGAVGGAVALAVVGFSWGGWVTGGNAETIALKRSQAAVVRVLTPMCIEKFRANANSSAKLVELKNIGTSWMRRDFIVNGGWATFGQDRPFELADACAEALGKL